MNLIQTSVAFLMLAVLVTPVVVAAAAGKQVRNFFKWLE
jgi:hypothetical protein